MKNFNELIELLKAHPSNWKEYLENTFYIHYRECPWNPNWFVLKYEQGLSPEESPIVKQARGTCFEYIPGQDPRIICAGLLRFYNHWKLSVIDPIDWASARVQNKLDGQAIKMYKVAGKDYWNSNAAFGVNDESMSIRDHNVPNYRVLLEKAKGTDLDWISKVPDGWTLWFELCSPYNTIVCEYKEIKLWFLGARDENGDEHWAAEIKERFGMPYDLPEEYDVHSLDEVFDLIKDWKCRDKEGVVVVDKYFHRIKVKTPEYLGFVKSTMDLGGGPNAIFKMVLNGQYKQFDDVNPAAFDKYRTMIEDYEKEIFQFSKNLDILYSRVKAWQNVLGDIPKKNIAQWVFCKFSKKNSGIIFSIMKWDKSYDEFQDQLLNHEILKQGLGKNRDGVNSCRKKFTELFEIIKSALVCSENMTLEAVFDSVYQEGYSDGGQWVDDGGAEYAYRDAYGEPITIYTEIKSGLIFLTRHSADAYVESHKDENPIISKLTARF